MSTPLPPTGDDGVEELAQSPARAGLRRLRLDIAVGALVLFGVLLLVRMRDGGVEPSATSTPAPQSSSTGINTAADERPPIYPVPNRHQGNLAPCPSGFVCPVSTTVSAGIQNALRAAFPNVEILDARVVRSVVNGYGQAIWSADVRARAGEQQITVRLQPLSPTDPEQHGVTLFNGHAITHWEGVLSQLRVVINVVAPADQPASLETVGQLAHDTQMLSAW